MQPSSQIFQGKNNHEHDSHLCCVCICTYTLQNALSAHASRQPVAVKRGRPKREGQTCFDFTLVASQLSDIQADRNGRMGNHLNNRGGGSGRGD